MTTAAFGGAWRGRRVLVTGHTGFKGAWLAHWLDRLGADVTGFAKEPEHCRQLFEALELEERCRHVVGDLRDRDALARAVAEARPEAVFHLAAQSLVRRSYDEARETWETNVLGTMNLLEELRASSDVQAIVVVTSDKCYQNVEREEGYREDDPLGGHDPYSASKAATEILAHCWRRSFFQPSRRCRLATARAGNVIGGGDRSPDRIVADFIAAVEAGRPLELRNPEATRPWQHVLDSLSGYLLLGARLLEERGSEVARAFNFGPELASVVTVEQLARRLVAAWGSGTIRVASERGPHESMRLTLDASLAKEELGWRGAWSLDEAVQRTVDWHRGEGDGANLLALADSHLELHAAAARHAGLAWAGAEAGGG